MYHFLHCVVSLCDGNTCSFLTLRASRELLYTLKTVYPLLHVTQSAFETVTPFDLTAVAIIMLLVLVASPLPELCFFSNFSFALSNVNNALKYESNDRVRKRQVLCGQVPSTGVIPGDRSRTTPRCLTGGWQVSDVLCLILSYSDPSENQRVFLMSTSFQQ